jgi:hypothetical protein
MPDDTLAELFARDPTKQPHSDADLQRMIDYYRAARQQFMLDPKPAQAASRAKKEKVVPLEDLLS